MKERLKFVKLQINRISAISYKSLSFLIRTNSLNTNHLPKNKITLTSESIKSNFRHSHNPSFNSHTSNNFQAQNHNFYESRKPQPITNQLIKNPSHLYVKPIATYSKSLNSGNSNGMSSNYSSSNGVGRSDPPLHLQPDNPSYDTDL